MALLKTDGRSASPGSRSAVRALALACALALSSGTASARKEAPPPQSDWDMIAFEMKSWGITQSRWQYSREYGRVWIAFAAKPDAPQPTQTLSFHTLEPDNKRYAALAQLVSQVPVPAPDPATCKNMMTDQPYGTIRMTRGATTTEIAWNAGCQDKDYLALLGTLREADALVAAWGKAAPVNRTEDQPAR